MGKWLPNTGNLIRYPRDAAFLPDGQLLLCESGLRARPRAETATETMAIVSNFLDVLAVHPKNPEFVYCYGGDVYQLDHQTGAWTLVAHLPGAYRPAGDAVAMRHHRHGGWTAVFADQRA